MVGTSRDVGALAPSIILPLPFIFLTFSLLCICREVSSLVQCTFFVMVLAFPIAHSDSGNVNHSKTFTLETGSHHVIQAGLCLLLRRHHHTQPKCLFKLIFSYNIL